MSAALVQNLVLLRQGVDLLQRIDDDVYCAAAAQHETSYRVGPHLRHCIDAYYCLLRGLESYTVDYDQRDRERQIEADRRTGITAIEELIEALEALGSADPDTSLQVRVDTPSDAKESNATGRSTLYRELQFLVGHTVHHYALIAMILRQRGFNPGPEFGVAPSTLQHWERDGTPRA